MTDAISISSELIGTERDLVLDDRGRFSWTDETSEGAWALSGEVKKLHDRCLDTLIKLSCSSVNVSSPDERWVTMMRTVCRDMTDVPWRRVMPERAHRALVKGFVDAAVLALSTGPKAFYEGTWVNGNRILRALRPAMIDRLAWDRARFSRTSDSWVIESFKPDRESGLASEISYDRFGAVTGRLTVDGGPNALVLRKEDRSIVKSVHGDDGCIVALDFNALEARIALYENGRRCDDPDLYGSIADELGMSGMRKAVKGAVICELYGGNVHAMVSVLGIDKQQASKIVKDVRVHFGTKKLLDRVKKQFVESGRISNRYGRPVLVDVPNDNILVNYYCQSTGVDVALTGFGIVMDELSVRAPSARPLFVIHDGLVIDVMKSELEALESVNEVKVPGYVQAFPLKCLQWA